MYWGAHRKQLRSATTGHTCAPLQIFEYAPVLPQPVDMTIVLGGHADVQEALAVREVGFQCSQPYPMAVAKYQELCRTQDVKDAEVFPLNSYVEVGRAFFIAF